MLFNSYVFLLFFLPITLIGYYIINYLGKYRVAQAWILIASFVFYGYENYRFCYILLGTILVNYFLHYLFIERLTNGTIRKVVLFLGVAGNLGLLFYFKYVDFFLDSVNRLFGSGFAMRNIVLPLGISFFTFQQLSFLVDSYKGDMQRYELLEYAVFVSFFPQLVAGPIVLHQEMIPQFRDEKNRRINYENLTSGLEYLVLGFAKKVLVADSFARICDAGYENLAGLNSLSAVLVMLAFTLEIYFDFSGYCDMAIGLGKLFNIQIPYNFVSPYKSLNIAEFWKRWHITLTRFLTTYLYIPLGGNRKGTVRTLINVMIVFTLSGLWHGAQWTFVLWGMIHGAMMVVYRIGKKVWDRLPRLLLWIATFLSVNVAWVFFRADYFRQPFRLFERMLVGGSGWCQEEMVNAFAQKSLWLEISEAIFADTALQGLSQVALLLWFAFWIIVCARFPSSHEMVEKKNRSTVYFVYLGVLLAWSFMWLSQMSKFIYFNF